MKVLQTKRKGSTETNDINNVSNVRIDGGYTDNQIFIGFGSLRPGIELGFAKDDTYRLTKLYNEIILSIHNNDYTYLSVEFDENNLVHQWWWHDDFEELLLEFPDRKYKVSIDYAFHVDVAVDAKDEVEAERKAQKMVDCGQFADEVNAAVEQSNVIECHAEEIK